MGLLTVVSLSGFSYLFHKYIANSTVSEANDRIWAVKVLPNTLAVNHQPISIDGYGNLTSHGYPVTQYYNDTYILTVEIHDVPRPICHYIQEIVLNRSDIALTVNLDNTCIEDSALQKDQNILKFSLPPDPCIDESLCGPHQVKVNNTCVCQEGYSPGSDGQCQIDLCSGKVLDECQTCDISTGAISSKADGELCTGGYCANGTCVPANDSKPCKGKVEGTPCVSNNRSGACINGYCMATKYLNYNQATVYCASQGGLPSDEQLASALSGSQKTWSVNGCFYKELYTIKSEDSCRRNGGSYNNFICHLKNYNAGPNGNYCGKVMCQNDL